LATGLVDAVAATAAEATSAAAAAAARKGISNGVLYSMTWALSSTSLWA